MVGYRQVVYSRNMTTKEYTRQYTPLAILDPGNPDDVRHGTLNGYSNHHCKCQPCLDYGRAYHREASLRRRQRGLEPDSPAHGTDGGYVNYGCRCDRCKQAHSSDHAAYRARDKERRREREAAAVVAAFPELFTDGEA